MHNRSLYLAATSILTLATVNSNASSNDTQLKPNIYMQVGFTATDSEMEFSKEEGGFGIHTKSIEGNEPSTAKTQNLTVGLNLIGPYLGLEFSIYNNIYFKFNQDETVYKYQNPTTITKRFKHNVDISRFSIFANYPLNNKWSIGAKYGFSYVNSDLYESRSRTSYKSKSYSNPTFTLTTTYTIDETHAVSLDYSQVKHDDRKDYMSELTYNEPDYLYTFEEQQKDLLINLLTLSYQYSFGR